MGKDLAVAMVGEDQRRRHPRPLRGDGAGGQRLGLALQDRVDRRLDRQRAGIFAAKPVGEQRRQRRKRVAAGRQGGGHGGPRRLGREQAQRLGAGNHAVAGGAGGRAAGGDVGAAAFGRLRQRHQQRRLGGGQAARFLAEPHQAGRAHPFGVAAIGREAQVQVQHALLADPPFQRQRQPRLPDLAAPVLGRPPFQQPRGLHRQGRGPRHGPPVPHRLRRGAQDRPWIDAVVVGKTPILPRDQHGHELRIDPRPGRGEAPQPVLDREGAQQAAVAGQHLDPGRHREVRQRGGVDPGRPGVAAPVGGARQQGQRRDRRDQAAAGAPFGPAI